MSDLVEFFWVAIWEASKEWVADLIKWRNKRISFLKYFDLYRLHQITNLLFSIVVIVIFLQVIRWIFFTQIPIGH